MLCNNNLYQWYDVLFREVNKEYRLTLIHQKLVVEGS